MVLLDADRFGVSQLHQLRGRVGRGGLPGLCLLVSWAEAGSPARDRLDAVARTTDGFELSRVDLEQRREGDVLGASQSGRRSRLRHLRVLRDEKTIVDAREAAEGLLDDDPDLAGAPAARRRRHRARVHGRGRLPREVVTGPASSAAAPAAAASARPPATPPGPPATGCVRRSSAHRVVVRQPPGAAVPRPVRRQRRGRARGVVARRGGRHPRRVRPPHRRDRARPTPTTSAPTSTSSRAPSPRSSGAPRRATTAPTTSCSATRRTRSAPTSSPPTSPPWCRGSAPTRWWSSSGRPAAPSRCGRTASTRDRSKRYGETTLWYGHAP